MVAEEALEGCCEGFFLQLGRLSVTALDLSETCAVRCLKETVGLRTSAYLLWALRLARCLLAFTL